MTKPRVALIYAFIPLLVMIFANVAPKPLKEFVFPNSLIISSEITSSHLETSNGCGINNFFIPLEGDTSKNIPSTVITLSDLNENGYITMDTLLGEKVLGAAFLKDYWYSNCSIASSGGDNPYMLVTDKGIDLFQIIELNPFDSFWSKLDSIPMEGIRGMTSSIYYQGLQQLSLWTKENGHSNKIKIYEYPSLNEYRSYDLEFELEIFEQVDSSVFVTGVDSAGVYQLVQYKTIGDSTSNIILLNDHCSNAKEFIHVGDLVYLLSNPGDTSLILTTISLVDSLMLSQSEIAANISVRATYNEYQGEPFFTYQYVNENTPDGLHEVISVLNPARKEETYLNLDKTFNYFKYPKEEYRGFGFYDLSWIGSGGEVDTGKVYLNNLSDELITIDVKGTAKYINAILGCWVNTNENELDKIHFDLFPNPASTAVTIKLKGLTKGQSYLIELVDGAGKTFYANEIFAYQKMDLPLVGLSKGIYFIKLNTGKNVLTQKLIVQ